MKNYKISIGSDHAGFQLKEDIKRFLALKNFEVIDQGTFSPERADYPDFAHLVSKDILANKADFGVIICGSGNGINMTANRYKGIRSALCWNSEIAELARQHNDANVIALPARFISVNEAEKCVETFIQTAFEGGRHLDRIKKIEC
jgi:ribose 5-phosphate isomerase B